jgi:2-polyprenyl-3-methyl-5-hydroxy-6-metoxy-1,4-benzoquinol methylase
VLRDATHQTKEQYEAQYLTGSYQKSSDRHSGCVPYGERYEHDLEVSIKRWVRYGEVLNGKTHNLRSALDVGCANGAFVDAALSNDVSGWGIDLSIVRSPHPRYAASRVFDLPEYFPRQFDLITYHDVLEHVIDPAAELVAARKVSTLGGVIIIDVPDVSTPEGHHHYKPEHLWYFNEEALRRLLASARFEIVAGDRPIPGKLVVYGEAR